MKKKETKEDMQAAENFFKEVSADVKSDNMKKLWDTYGLQIIIAVVIILTIAVSFETLKAWKLKHNESPFRRLFGRFGFANPGTLRRKPAGAGRN